MRLMAKKCIEHGKHLVIPALNLEPMYQYIKYCINFLYGEKRYVLHLDSIHLGFNEVKCPTININTCVVENFV